MKRTMLLLVAMIWSISAFAAMPPFDHKVKINPTDAWATVTNQTANYDDESKFGLTESSNTWSVNVADNNDVLPASVVWRDQHNVQHIVILRDKAATLTIIVPAIGNVAFIGADGAGERRDVNVGINSWQKIKFSVNSTGRILIEGVSLEGTSFVNQAKWKEALTKVTTGIDLYTAILPNVDGLNQFDHSVKIHSYDSWEIVTNQTANFDDELKFGLTEGSNTWSVSVPNNHGTLPALVAWTDQFSVKHTVVLRDRTASFTIIVPLSGRVRFNGADVIRENVDVNLGETLWQKIKFSVNSTGRILIEGVSLEGTSFVKGFQWREVLEKSASGVDLYTAIETNKPTYTDYQLECNQSFAYYRGEKISFLEPIKIPTFGPEEVLDISPGYAQIIFSTPWNGSGSGPAREFIIRVSGRNIEIDNSLWFDLYDMRVPFEDGIKIHSLRAELRFGVQLQLDCKVVKL